MDKPGLSNDAARIAWVTGASSGIGRALALRLADDGWKVVASARGQQGLDALAMERPGAIFPLALDVTDREAVRGTIDDIEGRIGAIELAVFSAGTYMRDQALAFDTDAFATMLNLNVLGTVHCLTAVAETMARRGRGHIAVTSSVAGYSGLPGGGAYGATKAALLNLCEAFYPELEAANVRLSIINPGFVDTPLTRMNDFPMPFLISADAAAGHIVRGLQKGRFEIVFPWKMALATKLLRLLPYPLVFAITRRMLRQDARIVETADHQQKSSPGDLGKLRNGSTCQP